MTAQQLYRREGDGTTVACVLADITILYHRPSGQTHMVVSPVPEILEALTDAPSSAADIHARLAEQYDMGDAAEAIATIAAHLAELSGLGLVRAA